MHGVSPMSPILWHITISIYCIQGLLAICRWANLGWTVWPASSWDPWSLEIFFLGWWKRHKRASPVAQELCKPLVMLCLQTFHEPKQITWLEPKSRGEIHSASLVGGNFKLHGNGHWFREEWRIGASSAKNCMGHTHTKKFSVVYPKLNFNWVSSFIWPP